MKFKMVVSICQPEQNTSCCTWVGIPLPALNTSSGMKSPQGLDKVLALEGAVNTFFHASAHEWIRVVPKDKLCSE
jgi:hypothetical protein